MKIFMKMIVKMFAEQTESMGILGQIVDDLNKRVGLLEDIQRKRYVPIYPLNVDD